jgi:hypothetical protein
MESIKMRGYKASVSLLIIWKNKLFIACLRKDKWYQENSKDNRIY